MKMAVVFIFIFSIEKVLSDVNVAFGKEVTDCKGHYLSQLVVDGDKTITNSEVIEVCCTSYCSVHINLGADYYIHYVVVYGGITNKSLGTLDEFLVTIESTLKVEYTCSTYSKYSMGSWHRNGMRVNCKFGKGKIVTVKANQSNGFSIAEIEIYTIGFGSPDQEASIYHGCFQNLSNIISIPLVGKWTDCIDECRKSLYPLAAFFDNQKCYCGKTPHGWLPVAHCNKICGNYFCGGDEAYSVYLVHVQLPHYLGCHSDSEIGFSSTNMTVIYCIQHCLDNYKYAMLKNGKECICSNQTRYNSSSASNSCDVPCNGDSKMICGGKHAVSLYSVTSELMDLKILQLMRCIGNYNELGICIDGCVTHYVGDHCIEASVKICKDIKLCSHLANTECVVTLNGTSFECQCRRGFTNDVLNKQCHDIDECLENPCDNETSLCYNTEGSYNCFCKPGYFLTKLYGCIEDDLICSRLKPCIKISNSYCVISGSNYKCKCNTGYIKMYGICIVDVCEETKPCKNLTNTYCKSIGNSYKCRCIPGYIVSNGICIDIDECQKEACDMSASKCINLNGSYYCKCNSDLTQITPYLCIRNISIYEANVIEPTRLFVYFFVFPFAFIIVAFSLFWYIGDVMKKSKASIKRHRRH